MAAMFEGGGQRAVHLWQTWETGRLHFTKREGGWSEAITDDEDI